MRLVIETVDGRPWAQLQGDNAAAWELLERIAAAGGRTGGWTLDEVARASGAGRGPRAAGDGLGPSPFTRRPPMLTRSRPWLLGLTLAFALGTVLGAATVSRGTAGRGEADAVLARLAQHIVIVDGPLNGLAGPHLIFEGVNVHVRSGSGSTDDGTFLGGGTLTGLGNLIVGYNEPPVGLDDGERSGSHTLAVGAAHRYSGFGGLVAGLQNTVSDGFTSVTGGGRNRASAMAASISGRSNQTAGNDFCWRVGTLNEGC